MRLFSFSLPLPPIYFAVNLSLHTPKPFCPPISKALFGPLKVLPNTFGHHSFFLSTAMVAAVVNLKNWAKNLSQAYFCLVLEDSISFGGCLYEVWPLFGS